MKYKIKTLKIKNFKCFEVGEFDFKENNLVILDGPNGYGKTTIFDAIEILLTGIPRRIRDSKNIIKTYGFSDSPIHNDPSKPIELIISLQNGDAIIKIKKTFAPASTEKAISNNPQKIFELAETSLTINEEDVDPSKISTLLKFENLENLYNVLNYIEQDENTYFLKKNPKEKYKDLVTLLGVEKQLNKLNSIKSFRKNLQKLIKNCELQIDNIEKNEIKFNNESSPEIKYIRLLDETDHYWDQKDLEISSIDSKNKVFEELNRIKYLIKHTDDIEIIIAYNKFNEFSELGFINSFLENFWIVANLKTIEEELSLRIKLEIERNQIEKIEELVNQFQFKDLIKVEYLQVIESLPHLHFNIEKFVASAEIINTLKKSLSFDFQILEEIKSKRDALHDFYFKYQEKTNLKDNECPTCGIKWSSNEKLIEEIKITEDRLFDNYETNNFRLENEKKSFQEQFLIELIKALGSRKDFLNQYLSNHESASEYQKQIDKAILLKKRFRRFLNLLDPLDVQSISNKYLQKKNLSITNDDILLIENIINNNRPTLDRNIIYEKILNDFSSYFENNLDQVQKLTLDDIIKKEKYIEYRYLSTINRKLNSLKNQREALERLNEKTKTMESLFDSEIKDYVATIVRKITIPFYIYTGKILQQHSLGSGLIFDADIDRKDPQIKIRPIYSEQEVSYTLSSGQQAATVISLLIVLNKVYGKSDFAPLLIDDPLQTLDEINTHSLIEVLKYNFPDQQIILSTHEDRYSRFFRYKFDKFGLSQSNINLRNQYLG